MLSYELFPHLNAMLNATSALLAVVGYVCIRRKERRLHRALMISAVTVSVLFLASYLTYHAQAGTVRFQGQGWIRLLYFGILASHTIFAVLVLPLVVISLWQAFSGRYERHRKIARWTLPIWVYASITGVLVYLMLYRHG